MRVLRAVLLFAVICCTTTASFAATLEWISTSDNHWNNAANWNPAQLPQTGDTLRFTTNGTVTNMINDLPAGTSLNTLTFFVFPAVSWTVGGSTVEVSTRISAGNVLTFNAPLRATGALAISGDGTYTSTFDVNGQTVEFGGAVFTGPVVGTGKLYNQNGTVFFKAASTFSGTITDAGFDGCSSLTRVQASFPSATIDVRCNATASGTFGTLITSAQFSPGSDFSVFGRATAGSVSFLSSRRTNMDGVLPYRVEIGGTTAGSSYDQVTANGPVSIQAAFISVVLLNGFTPAPGQTFVIIDNDGTDPVSGTFNTPCFGCAGIPYAEGSTITSGNYSFRISYVGGTGNDVVLTAIGTSTTTVTTSPNPSKYGQPVTITATVTGSGSATPTGTVNIAINGGSIGTFPLVNGQASTTISTIGGGGGNVNAAYSGDANYGTSISPLVFQSVQATQTTTTLTATPNPSAAGQTVTFTSTSTREQNLGPVTDNSPVTFLDGGVILGTALTANGVATFATSSLSPGSHNVTARFERTYFSQQTNEVSSTSGVVVQVVRSGTAISATVQPAQAGASATVSATVTSSPAGGGTPAGTVTVSNGDAVLGSATLDANGSANVTLTALPAGTYPLTVSYSGGGNFAASSTTITLTVNSLTIAGDDETIVEGSSGQSTVRVSVRLSFPATQTVTVNYTTADGTATAGSDYVASSGTVTFAPGETRATISIPVNGDVTPEADERFVVRLSNPQNAQLQRSQLNVTILNDDESFTVVRDLEYANVGGTSLMLDLFLPVDGKLHPVIVGIDAADWNSPIRQTSVITREAGRGYAVAMISFRPATTAQMPAQINDVKAAIRWLRANSSRFGLDPSRFGVWGIGAGGHLAALLGTTNGEVAFEDPSLGNPAYPSTVSVVVDWYGATNLTALATDASVCGDTVAQITQLLGCSATSCPDKARAASATTFVTRNDATFLIMHGSADCNVPISQSRSLNDALRAAGVDSTLVVNEGAGHGGAAWNSEGLLQQVDAFFDSELMPLLPRVRRSQH